MLFFVGLILIISLSPLHQRLIQSLEKEKKSWLTQKIDLLKRIKMLEYALWKARSLKSENQPVDDNNNDRSLMFTISINWLNIHSRFRNIE